ncbi:DUF1564 domain-containing protein [Leptospira sp. 201903071]|uniref:DUF1564 domain-containing protein n=1 Tax=Leptospira ainazelensis TaxID=2810034 RepID=UPI001966237D|nr:DUF1564 domain-containing protein [Leptospira ainazelensis]MBM9502699.1 DUF1564 domain-containing protein [Leptospira ainazelensis]
MGIFILNSERQIRSVFEDRKSEIVTLLIPEARILSMSKEERKEFPKKLAPLIRKYQKYLVSSKRLHSKAGKILYNRDQGPLKKLNLRMKNSDWNLLSVLAATHGVSRCFLVNYLLWLDEIGVGESLFEKVYQGVPTSKGIYQFKWDIHFETNRLIRSLQVEPAKIFIDSYRSKKKPPT